MLPARGELTIARVLTDLRQHFRWPRRHQSGGYGTLQKVWYLMLILV